MKPKTELYWSISLMAGGFTALYTQFPFHELVSSCLVVAAIGFLLDYLFKPTILKTYLKFVYDMEKEGKKINKKIRPSRPIFLRYLKYEKFIYKPIQPLIMSLIKFKPISEQEMIDARVNHFEWARLMVYALEFIFPKPEKGFPASFLFKNERPNEPWEGQLHMNLQAFTVLKKLNSGQFSDGFRKAPEALEQIYKSYLKNKR